MGDETQRTSISLTAGGPFYRMLTRLKLRTPTSMKRSWSIGILVWLPLAIGEGVRLAFGMPIDPFVTDLSVHARLLVALPLLLSSELLLEATAASAMASLYDGDFLDRGRLDPIVERAERLRDARIVEIVLFAFAVFGGQLALWGFLGSTGLFHGGIHTGFWSFPRVWYAIVALPVFQFVLFRWVWRWLIWAYVLARLAREPLRLLATHADLAGGLAALARPVTAFSTFVLGNAAILSGAWTTQVLAERTTEKALLPPLAVFLVTAVLVATGPLLLLSGHLFRGRRRTLAQYGDFMRWYTLRFHARWIEGATDAENALGSADIQSLADIGNAYAVTTKTRLFVFSGRNVMTVWFAGLLPMVPVFVNAVTVEQVLRRIIATVLGGLPL